jgi:hypothetical protein
MFRPVFSYGNSVHRFISVCYAFTIRHLGVASFSRKLCDLSDLEEALSLVSRLVPFLMDRKSTLVHTNLTGVITDLWSRFDKVRLDTRLAGMLILILPFICLRRIPSPLVSCQLCSEMLLISCRLRVL